MRLLNQLATTYSNRCFQAEQLNSLFCTVYPFLHIGLEWARPEETLLNVESDVTQIEIGPEYLPMGEEAAIVVPVGRSRSTKETLRFGQIVLYVRCFAQRPYPDLKFTA